MGRNTENSEPVLHHGAEKLISSVSPFEKPSFVFDFVEVASGNICGSAFAFRGLKFLHTGFLEHSVQYELE